MVQTAVLCILGGLLCLFLRETERPQAALLGLFVTAAALLSALPEADRIVQTAENLWVQTGLDSGYFALLCKAAGISWLTALAADVCRDCGESAAASAAELCGRVSLTALSLPLFIRLAELVLEVLR